MSFVQYDPENYTPRWVGYFDLLGTSLLIRSDRIIDVFSAYRNAMEHLNSWRKRHSNVYHAWFSDTFLVFSDDDTAESFAAIEMVCRWLVFALLRRKIPVRGALSCGQFYADRSNSLYLGHALLEAYEWGENQDWIGLVLCPSSVKRLAKLNLPIEERLNYVKCDIPLKKLPNGKVPDSAACILGNWVKLSGERNALLGKLKEMSAEQQDERIRRKYERTINFIIKHERKSS